MTESTEHNDIDISFTESSKDPGSKTDVSLIKQQYLELATRGQRFWNLFLDSIFILALLLFSEPY